MFNEFIYPFVKEQAERILRTIFQLDDPDMIRHLTTLLEGENINAIQWIFGAGGGKALYVYCEEDEVLPLANALDAGIL